MYTAAINIKNVMDEKVDKDVSFVLSIILLAICFARIIIEPIVMICFYKRGDLS